MLTAVPDAELRWDQHRRDWIVLAPSRAQRPSDPAGPPLLIGPSGDCPLCPGQAARTPPELFRLPDGAGGWRVRVVGEELPLFQEQPGTTAGRQVRHGTRSAIGHHELVIESPRHDWSLAAAPPSEVADVLFTWQQRMRTLRAADGLLVAFRDHGGAAGISLEHPHSQVVAMPVVPAGVRHELAVAREYFQRRDRCLRTDGLAAELAGDARIVLACEHHVALTPFASTTDFELEIVPRRSRADFAAVPQPELHDLADVLGRTLRALSSELADPAYSLVVHTAPSAWQDAPFLCWRLRLIPRLGRPGGFELGSGTAVCTCPPEEAASRLRRWVRPPQRPLSDSAAPRSGQPVRRDTQDSAR